MKVPTAGTLPETFFLPVSESSCFCIFHAPQGEKERGAILYLHPFAEELNASRRIVAHQARALAQLGYGVLQVDLLGCGDSSGEFEDASWASWMETATVAGNWLQKKISGPLWIWGLRAGTLLAAALADHFQTKNLGEVNLLFWQPVASGQQMLQQFLRLHSASEWMGNRSPTLLSPRQMLEQGDPVEIAGYTLSANFARELSNIQLHPVAVCADSGPTLLWLEVSSHNSPKFGPSSEKMISEWRKKGWNVKAQIISDILFWQTIHDWEAPELLHATNNALLRLHA